MGDTKSEATLAEVVHLSATIDQGVRNRTLSLDLPRSRDLDATLETIESNPRAVDYIIQSESH
jgi:hypothetical protein